MRPGAGSRVALVALGALFASCWPPSGQGDLVVSSAEAASVTAGDIAISEPWAAATPRGARVAAGYMTVSNHAARGDTLVSASSPRASRVEVHEMSMDGAMMRMRRMPSLALPAGGAVVLAPGGKHLMFIAISRPFVEGETIPVRLEFERAGIVTISLPVRARTTTRGGDDHSAHGGH